MIYLPDVRAIRQTLQHGETTKMGLMTVHKSEEAFPGTTSKWENLASVDVTLEFADVPGNENCDGQGGSGGPDGPSGGLEDTPGIRETGPKNEGDIGGSGGESGIASDSVGVGSAEPGAEFSSGSLDGEGETAILSNIGRQSHHGAAAAPASSEARTQDRGNEGPVPNYTTFGDTIKANAAIAAKVITKEAVQLALDLDFSEDRQQVGEALVERWIGDGVAGRLGKLMLKGLSKRVGGVPGIFKYLDDNELLPLVYSDPTQATA